MSHKTKRLSIRVTEQEDTAFRKFAEKCNLPYSCLIRKILRESVNQSPDLLQEELVLFRLAIRQLVGIAHNLNQLVKALHSGFSPFSMESRTLLETRKCALDVKKELESYVMRTRQRWIKLQP